MNGNERETAVLPPEDEGSAEGLRPLPGEPGIPNVNVRRRAAWSKKGLLAAVLLLLSLVVAFAAAIGRWRSHGTKPEDREARLASNRPAAASAEPRKLELPAAPPASSAARSAAERRIPAVVPTGEELAEPIGVRRTGKAAPDGGRPKEVPPEDAPVMVVSTRPATATSPPSAERLPAPEGLGADPLANRRRDLDAYQRRLQGLLDDLTRPASAPATVAPGSMPSLSGALVGGPPPAEGTQRGGLFGGALQRSTTPRVQAEMLGDRSLMLPKGTSFTCALKTRVVNATSGLVGCQVQRNVFSDDGRVLLIERGSHLDGEYRIASIKPGTVRIPVLWTRVRTPNGVVVELESPGTGPLGESGIEGHVDNRWGERIGAALLLSLIDDTVQLVIHHESSQADAGTVVLPSTTAGSSKLAEKVLDSTINIPPLIEQNQGGIVGVYVARDVDFAGVYALRPIPMPAKNEGQP